MMAKIQFSTLHVVSEEALGISCLHTTLNHPLYKAATGLGTEFLGEVTLFLDS